VIVAIHLVQKDTPAQPMTRLLATAILVQALAWTMMIVVLIVVVIMGTALQNQEIVMDLAIQVLIVDLVVAA